MIELYNGDCCEILKNLKDNSIDIVITDIPYGISYSDWDVLHNNTNSALGGASEHQMNDTSFKHRGKPLNGWSKEDKKIPYEYEEWCKKMSEKNFVLVSEQDFPIGKVLWEKDVVRDVARNKKGAVEKLFIIE